MKKILIGLVAAMCCFALAAPAMAQVKISGMITLDAFYQDIDAQRNQGGVLSNVANFNREDRSQTNINLPQALNRFDVQWTSEDKKVHGRIQLRYGAATATGFGTRQDFDPEFAYIDYHWTPMWYTRFGRQEQTFAIMAPSQSLGQSSGHIVGAGWGNVHGGTARDGIKNFFKFSDMVRLEFELLDPSNDTLETGIGAGAAGVQENSVIPRMDLALNIKIANFVIEPSVTWLRQEYEGLALSNANLEDEIDIWGAALGVSAGFGPFKVSGEVVYGENLGAGNYVGGGGAASGIVPAFGRPLFNATGTEVEDSEVLAAWIDLAFDFGPFEIHGIVGYEKWENDAFAVANDDQERERWMYGVNMPIKVTKNFTIKPEVVFYDDDDEAKTGRADGLFVDLGSELVAGVQFQLVF